MAPFSARFIVKFGQVHKGPTMYDDPRTCWSVTLDSVFPDEEGDCSGNLESPQNIYHKVFLTKYQLKLSEGFKDRNGGETILKPLGIRDATTNLPRETFGSYSSIHLGYSDFRAPLEQGSFLKADLELEFEYEATDIKSGTADAG